jgi:hypothetical protein
MKQLFTNAYSLSEKNYIYVLQETLEELKSVRLINDTLQS